MARVMSITTLSEDMIIPNDGPASMYYICGRGFHNGYLRIEDNKRIWGHEIQWFTFEEIQKIISEIPNYIMFDVIDDEGDRYSYNQ
jgi:hypothetical protein